MKLGKEIRNVLACIGDEFKVGIRRTIKFDTASGCNDATRTARVIMSFKHRLPRAGCRCAYSRCNCSDSSLVKKVTLAHRIKSYACGELRVGVNLAPLSNSFNASGAT